MYASGGPGPIGARRCRVGKRRSRAAVDWEAGRRHRSAIGPPHRWRSDPGVVGIRLSGSGLCRRHGPTEILDFSAPEAPRYGPSSLLSRGRGLVLGWSSDEHAHTVTTVSGYGDLEVRPVGRGPEWSRGALARMAESMTCPECHVVGGLRLEWNGAFGAFSCEACSPAKR
jgi:hypothetical protein